MNEGDKESKACLQNLKESEDTLIQASTISNFILYRILNPLAQFLTANSINLLTLFPIFVPSFFAGNAGDTKDATFKTILKKLSIHISSSLFVSPKLKEQNIEDNSSKEDPDSSNKRILDALGNNLQDAVGLISNYKNVIKSQTTFFFYSFAKLIHSIVNGNEETSVNSYLGCDISHLIIHKAEFRNLLGANEMMCEYLDSINNH